MADYQFPDDRLYDAGQHMWFLPLGDGAYRVGITQFGAVTVGRLIAFSPRPEGRFIELDKAFATMESGKWIGAARLPFAATIVAVHDGLIDDAEPINADPYGAGWLVVVRPADENAARAVLVEAGAPREDDGALEGPG